MDHIQVLEASLTLDSLTTCSAGLKVMALGSWSKFGAEVRVHKPIKLVSQILGFLFLVLGGCPSISVYLGSVNPLPHK